MKGYRKKFIVTIVSNICDCHPETCNHFGYSFKTKNHKSIIEWESDNYNDYTQLRYMLEQNKGNKNE